MNEGLEKIDEMDSNQRYRCEVGKVEDDGIEWRGKEILKFSPEYDRSGGINSILIINGNDRPCYNFSSEDVEDGMLKSENWAVKIPGTGKTGITIEFSDDEIADDFVSWLSNVGEEDFNMQRDMRGEDEGEFEYEYFYGEEDKIVVRREGED
jgi:hypothetical protein